MMLQSTTNTCPERSRRNHLSIINNHLAMACLYNCRFPPTFVVSALQISSFLTNKANFPDDQMNVSKVLTRDYGNKSNWTLGENKPNSNPIKANFPAPRDETHPIQTQNKPNQTKFQPAHLLINRMKQICCVCGLNISFDSAKMALYTDNLEFEKTAVKKLNLLKHKRLNRPGRLRQLTGTLFAHSNSRNFLYTDDKQ